MSRLGEQEDLADYFTDREALCRKLEGAASGLPPLARRIWNVTGATGQGKSAVLRMLRLFCRANDIPVAFVAARQQFTETQLLEELSNGFVECGLKLKTFRSRLKQVREQLGGIGKSEKTPNDLVDHGVEAGLKIVEAAEGLHPAAKTVGGVGSALISFWNEWRKRRLAAKLGDPTRRLTDDFLSDTGRAAADRRLVILLDPYEQMAGVDDWLCDLLRRLAAFDVFVVIASRSRVGDLRWDDSWPAWRTQIATESLEPLSEADTRLLITRLYRRILEREPAPSEMASILKSGGASPLTCKLEVVMRSLGYKGPLLTSADDLEQIVEHFLDNSPIDLRPLVEAAACVRSLDREVLRALSGSDQFEQLRLVEPLRTLLSRADDGWVILRSLREVIDTFLRHTNPERHRGLHESAIRYYHKRIEELGATFTAEQNERRGRWEIERLYHSFQVSAERGMSEFRRLFERSLFRAEHLNFCKALINEVRGYELTATDQSWIRLYEALLGLQVSSDIEQPTQILHDLLASGAADRALRCCILECQAAVRFLRDDTEDAKRLHEECLRLCESFPEDAPGQARALIWLGSLSKKTGTGEEYFARALDVCGRLGGDYAPLTALLHKEKSDNRRLQGRFREAEESIQASIASYRDLKMEFELGHAFRTRAMLLIYRGRLREAEGLFKSSIDLFNRCASGSPRMYEQVWPLLGLGDVALGRRSWSDARRYYDRAKELCAGSEFETGVAEGCLADLCCAQGEWGVAIKHADRSLKLRRKHGDQFGIGWALHTKGCALAGRGRYADALDCLRQGLTVIENYGSVFVLCRLKLALAETQFLQGNWAAFHRLDQELHSVCIEQEYSDTMARLLLLRGLALLKEPAPPGVDDVSAAVAEAACCFCEALTWALRHNVFVLDAIVEQLTRSVPAVDPRFAPHTIALLADVRKRWTSAVVKGERAERMEKDERERERTHLRKKVTVAERLDGGEGRARTRHV